MSLRSVDSSMSDLGGTRVQPLSNGRTVMEEWRERAPKGSLAELLGGHHFFSASMLSFLGARAALRTRARVGGSGGGGSGFSAVCAIPIVAAI